MKSQLRRIEATLAQLGQQSSQTQQVARAPSFSIAVKPFAPPRNQGKIPSLPKLKNTQPSNDRRAANPALAINLLQDIEKIVAGWQQELEQLKQQIQALYLEGPIIDGWLESRDRQEEEGTARSSKVNTEEAINDREEILAPQVSRQSSRTDSQLCGLDEDGQLWSRPCPPDQVHDVSVAIARHQKLRQLLQQKQDREIRLSQLAKTLMILHKSLSERKNFSPPAPPAPPPL